MAGRLEWNFHKMGFVALLCMFALTLGLPASSYAATLAAPTPTLKAKIQKDRQSVSVSWKLPKLGSGQAATKLEIWRFDSPNLPPLGTVPGAVKVFDLPASKGSFVDVLGGGTYLYQARVFLSNAAGTPAWGKGFWVGDPIPGYQGAGCPSGWAADVLKAVNAARGSAGVANLSRSALLDAAAQNHNDYRNWYFSGTGADPGHAGWADFIRDAGFSGGFMGENIAYGYPTAEAVVGGWMRSAGHRANILRSNYRFHGIGCGAASVPSRNGELKSLIFWTEDFGG